MKTISFHTKLDNIVIKSGSLVSIGLDSDFDKLPDKFKKSKHPQFEFNKFVIEQTCDLVCAYKPNSAFYEARGAKGIIELKKTCEYLRKEHPEIVIILDAKRADINSTNEGYIDYAFEYLRVDAITLHPYLGSEAIRGFLKRKDKGCIILCRTSNPGAGELQDLEVGVKKIPLYKYIAYQTALLWNKYNNVLLVVGATYPEELSEVRKIVGKMTILVPGIGTQGGDVEKTVKAGLNSKRAGMIINSSRGIIFAEDPHIEAKKLKDAINSYR